MVEISHGTFTRQLDKEKLTRFSQVDSNIQRVLRMRGDHPPDKRSFMSYGTNFRSKPSNPANASVDMGVAGSDWSSKAPEFRGEFPSLGDEPPGRSLRLSREPFAYSRFFFRLLAALMAVAVCCKSKTVKRVKTARRLLLNLLAGRLF